MSTLAVYFNSKATMEFASLSATPQAIDIIIICSTLIVSVYHIKRDLLPVLKVALGTFWLWAPHIVSFDLQ